MRIIIEEIRKKCESPTINFFTLNKTVCGTLYAYIGVLEIRTFILRGVIRDESVFRYLK